MKKVFLLVLIFVVASIYFLRQSINLYVDRLNTALDRQGVILPRPIKAVKTAADSALPAPTSSNTPAAVKPLPEEINIDVPFTSQAPLAKWDSDHEEYCEEAAVLMAAYAKQGKTISSPTEADKELKNIVAWEKENLNGVWKSTTAEETVKILKQKYSLPAKLESNVYAADIKKFLAQNFLVIIPAAGQKLENPYFTPPGPAYHMLVVKGYTKDGQFITNDPGTKRGADYLYQPNTLIEAIHDWTGSKETIETGKNVVIVVE